VAACRLSARARPTEGQLVSGRTWRALALLCAAWAAAPVQAAPEAHALLMWVGRYGSPALDLPGIEIDAQRAREIAAAFGARAGSRLEVSEEALTLRGMVDAFAALERRVRPGDRVLIYFSGHGRQIDGRALGVRCSEGLVTQDAALYLDVALERSLQRLAARAAQVVMFNDSCHAGGAAAKSLGVPAATGDVPKRFSGALRGAFSGDDGAACGEAVNKSFPGAWVAGARAGAGAQGGWLYVAAAAADEIAYASPAGSRATAAWHHCLVGHAQPQGRQALDGEALRACAQQQLDRTGGKPQTITLLGDVRLRVAGWDGAGASHGAAARLGGWGRSPVLQGPEGGGR
jgi:hypothetical protein